MGILSGGAGPVDIAQMIAEGSVGMLTKLRGVGKKTAEMLVVELREKCQDLLTRSGAARMVSAVQAPAGMSAAKPAGKPDRLPILDDVAAALVQLGGKR